MSEQTLPVAMHRWFADGEDWAYHPSLHASLPSLINAVDHELKARGDGDFITPWPSGWLIGERLLDRQCPNVKAAKRLPTIFRVAHLPQPHEPTPHDRIQILAALRRVVLPSSHGPNENLAALFAPPPTLPVWPRARSEAGGFLSRRFFTGGSSDEPLPLTGMELARQLETYWRFYQESGTAEDLFPLLAVDWRGVTSSGRAVRRGDFLGLGGVRPTDFPALVPGRDQVEVLFDGSFLVVTGQPRWRDQSVRCVHVYVLRRDRGAWEMITATVTPLAGEAVAIPVATVARPATHLPAGGAPQRGDSLPTDPTSGNRGRPHDHKI